MMTSAGSLPALFVIWVGVGRARLGAAGRRPTGRRLAARAGDAAAPGGRHHGGDRRISGGPALGPEPRRRAIESRRSLRTAGTLRRCHRAILSTPCALRLMTWPSSSTWRWRTTRPSRLPKPFLCSSARGRRQQSPRRVAAGRFAPSAGRRAASHRSARAPRRQLFRRPRLWLPPWHRVRAHGPARSRSGVHGPIFKAGESAEARLLMGTALSHTKDYPAAVVEFKKAVD